MSLVTGSLVGVLMSLGAVCALSLYSATDTAVDAIQRSTTNETGKPAVLHAVWHDISGTAQTLLFGLGPGESVSRFAFLTTPTLLKAGSPVTTIGLSTSPGPDHYQAIAVSGAYNGGGSSFNGAQSSLFGILGDYGTVGFLTFTALEAAILLGLIRSRRTSLRAAALAAWTMLLPLSVVFDWLEEPPFTLAVMLVTGLALREPGVRPPAASYPLTSTDAGVLSYRKTSEGRPMTHSDSVASLSAGSANGEAPIGPPDPGPEHRNPDQPWNPANPLVTYCGMIWRRKLLVLGVALAMAVPAFLSAHFQTPVYSSSAQLLLTQTAMDANYNAVNYDFTDPQLNDEIALMTGPVVSARAAQLGASSTIVAAKDPSSHVITVQGSDAVPAAAAATVRAYLQAYSEFAQGRAQTKLDQAINRLRSRIDDYGRNINDSKGDDRSLLQQQQLRFSEQVTRLEIQRGVTSSTGTVVKEANVPTTPVSPKPKRDTLLAFVIGLVLGLSLAVLLEILQTRRGTGGPTVSGPGTP
jgi:capsular polysaccharide biosynthesis protein